MLVSPLRYPGGKAKLYNFLAEVIRANELFKFNYCEPYAGGAGLALRLLSTGFVARVTINDLDPAIYAFWDAALNHNDDLCERIETTPVCIEEWHRQQEIYRNCDTGDVVGLGYATFFLNRTNRSGIIQGAGPIGGYAQTGEWRLDARFQKEKQLNIMRAIKRYSPSITICCEDAADFTRQRLSEKDSFLYLDPPYYVKGKKLYRNFYTPTDHEVIRDLLTERRNTRWILSYDDVPEIRELYSAYEAVDYELCYSAGRAGLGREVMFASDTIKVGGLKGLRRAA